MSPKYLILSYNPKFYVKLYKLLLVKVMIID